MKHEHVVEIQKFLNSINKKYVLQIHNCYIQVGNKNGKTYIVVKPKPFWIRIIELLEGYHYEFMSKR